LKIRAKKEEYEKHGIAMRSAHCRNKRQKNGGGNGENMAL
jgi:hypothetical protein